MSIPTKPSVVVIVGPTASGKSELAVRLAKKFNGEVISADSRQVYRGLDIGSGKVSRDKTSKSYIPNSKFYLHQGILHHLLDITSPKKTFTVARYQKLARNTIRDILKRGNLPIICGGTGFYIQAVVDGILFPRVKPNIGFRKKLERKSNEELFKLLEKSDPARAKNIDRYNKRRLIRALEIVEALGKVPRMRPQPINAHILILGIKKNNITLKRLIRVRLKRRLQKGLVGEVRGLHRQGVSWKRLESLGLEYRYVAQFLQNKISKSEFIEMLEKEIWHYAKRQTTWFKHDKRIQWIKTTREAESKIKRFLA